jgi:beta-aspartyl-peptidase (threonine type)
MSRDREPVLIVHGGAWDIPAKLHPAHLAGMRAGLSAGRRILEKGGSALDAIEAAVRVMEEDPVFDAGRGSCLNTDGSVEMDASIMDGRDRSAGAVAALRNFLHPTSVARRVMEETEHILLAGEGAVAFARRAGFEPVDSMDLLTEREQERLRELRKDRGFRTPHAFGAEREDGGEGDSAKRGTADSEDEVGGSAKRGTVGAVARDVRGDIAAATSTGGTPKKIPGRVGDSALIGCGTFADNKAGGVSATGWGESIIRVGTARTVIDRLRDGDSAEAAARFAVDELAGQTEKGLGGVIVVDARGDHAAIFNTPNMARGWWTPGMAEPFTAV